MKAKRYRFRGSVVGAAILAVLFISALGLAQSLVYAQAPSSESGGTPFNKNKVLSDSDLVRSSAMSVDSIQGFLEDQGSALAAFSAAGKTAAQMIYDAGHKYGINPQVLLVLIQMRPAGGSPEVLNEDISRMIGRPEASADTFREQIDHDAQMLRAYYNLYANQDASLNDPIPVHDGAVKAKNAATAALAMFLPWIGEPNLEHPATGLFLFRQWWEEWFAPQSSSGAAGGTCPTITPSATVQRVAGAITRAGEIRDWCFMATAGQEFEFSTCPPEGSGNFDTVIEVLTGDGSRSLACNDDAPGCGLLSRLTFTAPSAGQYRIRVSAYGGSRPCTGGGTPDPLPGNFMLGYRIFVPPACTTLTPAPASEFQTVSDRIEERGNKDYCFTATEGVIYNFTTCDPGSADFDTIIEVLNNSGTTVLAANDDFCGLQSSVTWQAPSSGTFRVRILGFGSESGKFTLAYRTLPPLPCIDIEPDFDFQTTAGTLVPSGFKDYCMDAEANTVYEFTTCSPGSANGAFGIDLRTASGVRSLPVLSRGGCGTVPGQQVAFSVPASGSVRVRVLTGPAGVVNYSLAHKIVPSLNTPWSTNRSIPIANGLSQPTAVTGNNGWLYIIGGGLGPGPDTRSNQVWAYISDKDMWLRRADIPIPDGLSAFGAAAELNGFIYVFGGFAGSGFTGRILNTTWIYDVENDEWAQGPNMPGDRIGSAVAVVGDKIYIAGGGSSLAPPPTTLWEYDPQAATFTVKAPLPFALVRIHGASYVTPARREVHVFAGGFDGINHLIYDVNANTWRVGPLMIIGVTDPAVVTGLDNLIYVMGGPVPAVGRTQIFDPSDGKWYIGSNLPGPVNNTSGSIIGDTIYVVGGFNGSASIPVNYSSAGVK
jgi:hypothetical protein